jgi:hypothetical protein
MGKPFRPSFAFVEANILSPISSNSIGGIIWMHPKRPEGAQTPRGRDLEHQRTYLPSDNHQDQSRGQSASTGTVSSSFRWV